MTLLLAGCASTGEPAATAWDRGFFACSTVGGPSGTGRVIGIFPDPNGQLLSLNLGRGNVQTLTLVRSANARFYSNSSWAWKSANSTAFLTDIGNINVQSCRPVQLAGGLDALGRT